MYLFPSLLLTVMNNFNVILASLADANLAYMFSHVNTTLVQTEISHQLLDGLPFYTDSHLLQRMNPTDFSSSATRRLTFVVLIEMSHQLLARLP